MDQIKENELWFASEPRSFVLEEAEQRGRALRSRATDTSDSQRSRSETSSTSPSHSLLTSPPPSLTHTPLSLSFSRVSNHQPPPQTQSPVSQPGPTRANLHLEIEVSRSSKPVSGVIGRGEVSSKGLRVL